MPGPACHNSVSSDLFNVIRTYYPYFSFAELYIIFFINFIVYRQFSLFRKNKLILFSSPDPKGQVRYCHRLASVVRPLTFHILIYSSETTGPNGTKLDRKHLYKVLYKFLHFVPFRQQIWPPRAILVSDWLMLKKSSPLKLLGQMDPNLAGSIYVRSSIKLLHLIPFGRQTWPLLLKIEHMVKLHVFGNNSKTVNNIRNLSWKNDQHRKI